jgi:hypothetical protein
MAETPEVLAPAPCRGRGLQADVADAVVGWWRGASVAGWGDDRTEPPSAGGDGAPVAGWGR